MSSDSIYHSPSYSNTHAVTCNICSLKQVTSFESGVCSSFFALIDTHPHSLNVLGLSVYMCL